MVTAASTAAGKKDYLITTKTRIPQVSESDGMITNPKKKT